MSSQAPLEGVPDLATAFRQACGRDPARVAVSHRGQSLTYSQLQARVRAMAAGLTGELGRPGHEPPLAAILLRPGITAVCAALAAVTAGGAYLPLDAGMPGPYLREVLAAARPRVVITSAGQAAAPHGAAAAVVTPEELLAGGRETVPFPGPGRDDPAYVICTSGTTGKPKRRGG